MNSSSKFYWSTGWFDYLVSILPYLIQNIQFWPDIVLTLGWIHSGNSGTKFSRNVSIVKLYFHDRAIILNLLQVKYTTKIVILYIHVTNVCVSLVLPFSVIVL